MIKVKVNNEYKDIVKIFCGGTLQKEITKVWSREAQDYVYESSVEYTGSLPITITANGDALLDYRIYGTDGGVGVATENLWKYTSSMRNINLWTQHSNYFVYYPLSSEQVNVLKSARNISLRMFLKDGGVHKKGLTVAISDSIIIPSESIRLLQTNGIIDARSFKSESWSNAYLLLGNSNTILGDLADENVQSLFDNYDIAIVSGSIAPAEYIPYGYKLPMTVGNGNTAQTVPVYIGRNQLGEGEYVSYGEQKIYRDVSGTLTPTDPPVPLPEIPTIDGTTIIDYDGTPKPSQMYVKYRR